MANKKVSQLVAKPSVLVTDLFPIADPTTGQLYKTTISDLGTAIGSGVSSVNTLVGAVVLDTDDIQELASPTNRWFTDTRARAALSASSPLAYNSGTGVFSIPAATSSQNGFLTSTDWTTFNAKQQALSGTGFVKISGTTISYDNSTYLTTSAAASTYLALAGGTLTGALNGTSANFSGDLTISSANPRLYFTDTDNNPDYFISNTDGTFTVYDVTNSSSRFTIGTTGNGTFGGNLTVGQIIRSGGTSAQFLKADGSVDSSTYLTTGTAASTYLALAGGTMAGNIFLPANNTVGGTNYYIGQQMAGSDYWRIFGNSVSADQGEMVFSIGDNATPIGTNGQRFRFFYDNADSGTAKSPLTIDYNTSTFTTSIIANSATFVEPANYTNILIGTTSTTGAILTDASRSNLVIGAGTSSKIAFNNASTTQTGYIYNDSSELSLGFPASGTFNIQKIGIGNVFTIISSASITRTLRFQVGAAGIAAGNYCEFGNDDNVGYVDTVRAVNSGDFHFRFDGTSRATINRSTGVYVATSDINKKKDLEESKIGLNEVLQLKPTLYRMKSDTTKGEKELGFVAQEVKGIIPSAYQESGDFIGLNYNPIVAALTKAVQELKAELDLLKKLNI